MGDNNLPQEKSTPSFSSRFNGDNYLKTTNREVFFLAFKDIFQLPALAVAITFFSLGNLYSYSGFSLAQSIFTSAFVYSLPSQIVLADQFSIGASIFNMLISVFLINIRFFPMSFILVPLFAKQKKSLWYVLGVHFVAITGWNNFIENYQKIPPSKIKNYYFYSNFFLFFVGITCTYLGFIVVDYLSQEIYVALLITNPIYFLCLFFKSALVKKEIGLAMLSGGILIIPFSLVSLEWGVIFAGLIGGSLSFFWVTQKSKKK